MFRRLVHFLVRLLSCEHPLPHRRAVPEQVVQQQQPESPAPVHDLEARQDPPLAKSIPLPPEILALIIDHLRNDQAALRTCCLISKPWEPWARRHLFTRVEFSPTRPFVLWTKAFLGPDNSPAHHTRTLSIRRIDVTTLADPDICRYIRAFDSIETLEVKPMRTDAHPVSLVPLHGLSPSLKSLHLSFTSLPLSGVFNLICSFPLLEHLSMTAISDDGTGGWDIPPTSPRLTGSLYLEIVRGIGPAVRRLCNLPGGLHFSKIATVCHCNEDVESTTGLVSRCSDTLESLDVSHYYPRASDTAFLDLSKAAKLQDLVFLCVSMRVGWIHAALRTVKSTNLQRVVIYMGSPSPGSIFWDTVDREWRDLDQALVQLWTSHSIRTKILYVESHTGYYLRGQLPEVIGRGHVDLVQR